MHESSTLTKLHTISPYIKLFLGLAKALAVVGINEKDYRIDSREVLLPNAAGLLVASEIVCSKCDVANCELLRG